MARHTETPTRDQFARYLDDYPATFDLWRAGEAGLYRLLASLNIHPVALQREHAQKVGPHLTAMMFHSAHHNQVGIVVAWALQHMLGRATDADPPFDELERAFEVAGTYWSLKNVMADVYLGTRAFEANGRKIRIPYVGNAAFEATDRLLDTLDGVMSMPERPPEAFAALRTWEQSEGRDVPWEGVPLAMREELRAFARSISDKQESYLDPALDVGGFTMGDAEKILLELFARAWHAAAQIMRGSVRADVVLTAIPRQTLIGNLALTTRVPRDRVETIVDLLTVNLAPPAGIRV